MEIEQAVGISEGEVVTLVINQVWSLAHFSLFTHFSNRPISGKLPKMADLEQVKMELVELEQSQTICYINPSPSCLL